MKINLFSDPGVLTDEEKRQLTYLNSSIPALCESFGSGLSSQLALEIQMSVGRSSLDSLTGFFNSFYYPAWTTVYHLAVRYGFSEKRIVGLLKGQAMAMFLHLLDDHVVDGEIAVNHRILAIRSRAWQIYQQNLLDTGVSPDAFQESIRRYILAVSAEQKEFKTVDEYLIHFLDEAATWFVSVEFLADLDPRRELVLRMYQEFVLFWRLLDDLRDASEDLKRGDRTAFTILLSLDSDYHRTEERLFWLTEERLRNAASLAKEAELHSVGDQLDSLLVSLQKQTKSP